MCIRDRYYTGIVTTQSLRVIGDLEVEGTTTTLDTALTEVDKLEVGANNSTVGLAVTQSGSGANSRFTGGYVDIDTTVDSALNLNATDDGPIYSSFERSGTRIGYYGFGGSGNTFDVVNEATGGQFNISTPGDFKVRTNNAERIRVTSGGSVGIGTVSPTADLEIEKPTSASLEVGNTLGQRVRIEGGSSGISFNTPNALNMTFGTSNTERLRITSAGNVGINTINPVSYANSQATLVIEDTISPALCLSDTGQTRDWFLIGQGDGLAINYADGGGSNAASNVTSAMFIKNNGNIGINSTAPRAIVDFGPGTGNGTLNQTVANYQAVFEAPTGTGNYTRNIAFASRTSEISAAINAVDEGGSDATGLIVATGTAGSIAERLRITSDGNVGINQTSPDKLLHISSSSAPTIRIENTSTGCLLYTSPSPRD